MVPVDWRPVTVTFTSTVNPGLDWEFTPVQNSVGYLIFYGSCYKLNVYFSRLLQDWYYKLFKMIHVVKYAEYKRDKTTFH